MLIIFAQVRLLVRFPEVFRHTNKQGSKYSLSSCAKRRYKLELSLSKSCLTFVHKMNKPIINYIRKVIVKWSHLKWLLIGVSAKNELRINPIFPLYQEQTTWNYLKYGLVFTVLCIQIFELRSSVT